MAKTATATKPTPDQAQAQAPQTQPQQQGSVPATTKPKNPLVAFQEYLGERAPQLQFALPSHISPDRFTRIVLTALQRKPELLRCTRQSLWNACLLAAQDGLMPDGREGAIVPYGENEDGQRKAEIATWMPMIEGLRKKARNSGEIANWEAHVVRARDQFTFALGDEAFIDHQPYFGPEEPGEVVGAYSIVTFKDGTKSRDVMTIRDLLKIRAKSKAAKGPWNDTTFFPEMCKKTVARRHYKQLPHSSDLDDMIRRDDEAFGLDERDEDQVEQRQRRRIASVGAAFDQFAGTTIEHDEPQQQDQLPAAGDRGQATVQAEAGEQDHEAERQAEAEAEAAEAAKAKAKEPAGDGAKADQGKAADQAKPEGNGQPTLFAGASDEGEPEFEPWPEGKTPENADEYEAYALTIFAKPGGDPDKLSEWWRSEPERKLRNACGVRKELFDSLQATLKVRVETLRKKG